MKRITVILLAAVLMASCSKDNDDIINTELEGQWTLTDVVCFCFFDPDTDFGSNKLIFEGSRLTVENSGEFSYFTDAEGLYTVDGNLITFKNGDQFRYTVDGGMLNLSNLDDPQIADDEITFVYESN